jgi:Alpha/beta hydrolase domain
MARWRTLTTALLVIMLASAACSSDSSDGDDDTADDADREGDTEALPSPERPDGPAATVTGPLSGGDGMFLPSPGPAVDLADAGWVEEEYAAEGTATSYRAEGELPTDGMFELAEDATAEYRTRIVVRRPADAADFNGTVVVEWLNVSGGLDAGPDYSYMADELVRGGYAWVGVSAQRIGIEGGPVAVTVEAGEGIAGRGLRSLDPERYGDLHHPGDAFSYDIYTQVARALRGTEGADALGDLEPERLLAVGESQSAFALTTYVNGVQPLTGQFDGFLVHSRGGAAAPLGEAGAGIDIAGSIGGRPTRLRTDGAAPVVVLETETDLLSVLGYLPARQPDDERLRLWEVAGTAHADAYLIGPTVETMGCPTAINDGPHHFVVKAALRSLDTWVRTGEAPPEAPRLEVDESGATPAFRRDENGNATGGIRTPPVDVPVATLSGEAGDGSSLICLLLGSTTPLSAERLADLYPSHDNYLDAYSEAADAAIEAGFVLDDDREVLLAAADPDAIPG